MKIKHWQGYGSVNAKVIKRTLNTQTNTKTITIEVSGMHEYGLVRKDEYDVYHWLLKRFDKNCDSYSKIKNIKIDTRYEPCNEIATYHIEYWA